MNREILFKAKRKNWKELPKEQWWVEGYYRRIPCMGMLEHYIMPQNPKNRVEQDAIDITTLCQFAGLTDENGKKIWENDIISIHSYSYYEPEDDYFGVVKYCEKDACWVLKNNERFNEIICECFGSYTTQMINHGNIFDNADLLEVGRYDS